MAKDRFVFVGTYTEPILFGTGKVLNGQGKGIYVYRFDAVTSSMMLCSVAEGVPNPSYLTFDPSHRFLYAVNELKMFEGAATGTVSAFALDPDSGTLKFLNRQPSHGTDPCHLTVDPTGKYVLVANFMSGSVAVLPIRADGALGEATDVIQHQGSSVDPVRQSGPHAHAVTLDDTGRYVFVPDLGLDKVMIYRFDPNQGKLAPHEVPWVTVTPGAGPRQVVMYPTGQYAYLINELNSTMTTFRFDRTTGRLQEIQTCSTLPEAFTGTSTCAEVQISPSGRFLYGSNRGHDSLAHYAIDPGAGMLTYQGCQPTQGKMPRHFGIDPTGRFLIVAHQDTDNLMIFRLDPASGELHLAGQPVNVPTPVCVKFLQS